MPATSEKNSAAKRSRHDRNARKWRPRRQRRLKLTEGTRIIARGHDRSDLCEVCPTPGSHRQHKAVPLRPIKSWPSRGNHIVLAIPLQVQNLLSRSRVPRPLIIRNRRPVLIMLLLIGPAARRSNDKDAQKWLRVASGGWIMRRPAAKNNKLPARRSGPDGGHAADRELSPLRAAVTPNQDQGNARAERRKPLRPSSHVPPQATRPTSPSQSRTLRPTFATSSAEQRPARPLSLIPSPLQAQIGRPHHPDGQLLPPTMRHQQHHRA